MNLLTPTAGYKVSPALVAINTLAFLALAAMNFSFTQFSNESLYLLGANFSPSVEQGQWWRFLTSMFLHAGAAHFLFNSVSILFVGKIIEPLLGHLNFLGLYLMTGIAGSAASFVFNKDVISVGASGAIFGLFGIFIAILLSNIMHKDIRDQWLKSIGAILAINLAMGLIFPIDNSAHLGGLVSGVILGFAFIPAIKRRLRKAVQ